MVAIYPVGAADPGSHGERMAISRPADLRHGCEDVPELPTPAAPRFSDNGLRPQAGNFILMVSTITKVS